MWHTKLMAFMHAESHQLAVETASRTFGDQFLHLKSRSAAFGMEVDVMWQ